MNLILENLDIIHRDAPDISAPMVFTTATNSINMAGYDGCLAVLTVTDAGTGCVVTMKQGTTTTASTALGFDWVYIKADIGTNTWVKTAVTSDTFTTGVASATGQYAVDIKGEDLTGSTDYQYVRMNCASATNATGTLYYVVYNARYPNVAGSVLDAAS